MLQLIVDAVERAPEAPDPRASATRPQVVTTCLVDEALLLHLDPIHSILDLQFADVVVAVPCPVPIPVGVAVRVRAVDTVRCRWRGQEVLSQLGEGLAQLLVQHVAVVLEKERHRVSRGRQESDCRTGQEWD